MQVIYNQTNNLCINDSNGIIRISQILFTESEQDQYLTYTIDWSNNIPNNNISDDAATASFLPNGSYSFRVISLSSNATSALYNINIVSPPEFKITNVISNEYSCGDNGEIIVEVSGGLPPYTIFANNRIVQSTSTTISLDNLNNNLYTIRANDSNGCSSIWNKDIEIKLSSIIMNNLNILSSEILDGPTNISFDITGDGPFGMYFHNIDDSTKDFTIDLFNTEFITNIDSENKKYSYLIPNRIYPGSYELTIKTSFGCLITENISVPNIQPMAVSIAVNQNTVEKFVTASLTEPRFDTILIPYRHIIENTTLWQSIKNFNLKDEILIKIDDTVYHYSIVRYLSNKYQLNNNNEIEILKLGNSSDDWYYYFYIGPSVNLSIDNVISSKFSIISKNGEEFPLTLGLSDNGDLDSFNASLIRGSFLIPDTNLNSFIDGGNVYVSINEPEDAANYQFILKNTKNYILTNIYSLTIGYTAINFLEQFNVLNYNINLGQTSCNSSRDTYDYMMNVRAFIKVFNNFNNLDSIYIYNLDSILYNGNFSIFISGNDSIRVDDDVIENTYSIDYFYFNRLSDKLQVFVENNNILKNVYSIVNLEGGYVIARIRDINNNIPKILLFNDITINYDNHFTEAKQIIQLVNNNIVDSFQYGDILIYIPYLDETESIPTANEIPSPLPATIDLNQIFNPSPQNQEDTLSIKQTQDVSNTSSCTIRVFPKNTKCIIYGPYNYMLRFNEDITLYNMIPGNYTIVGDYDYLNINNLYQNENKIFIDKDVIENVSIIFQPYINTIFIRDYP